MQPTSLSKKKAQMPTCVVGMQARWSGGVVKQGGFTLIEILIAIAIFALLSALVFQTFNLQTRYHQQLSSKQQRWADVAKAWQIIERDLSQLVARPVRDEFGDVQAAVAYAQAQRFAFTTLNWYASEISLASQVQRVAYDFVPNDNVLYRQAWVHADTVPSSVKRRFVILDNVLAVDYQMISGDGRVHSLWPPLQQTQVELPRMITVSITTEDFGTIKRNFYVAHGG